MNRAQKNDFPHADSCAARLLRQALQALSAERGISLREVALNLGFKHAAVLSHMATGRMPIPLDRAPAIAAEVGLSPPQFLLAVLQQRHPTVDWSSITGVSDALETDLERTAGRPLSGLSMAHQKLLHELVRDTHPEERWLAIPEIAAVKFLRELFPELQTSGFSEGDHEALRLAADLAKTAGSEPATKSDGVKR